MGVYAGYLDVVFQDDKLVYLNNICICWICKSREILLKERKRKANSPGRAKVK
jgi:hypothetical protein